MNERIKSAWDKVLDWLDTNNPAVANDFRKPLDGQEGKKLVDIEKEGGFEIPEPLKFFVSLHHGQKDGDTSGLIFGSQLLGENEIYNEWNVWLNLLDLNEQFGPDMSSFPENAIKPTYANKLWIPLATDGSGNYIGMDLDPGEEGNVGQVITYGRDEDEKKLVADSLAEFLELFARQLYRFGRHTSSSNTIDFKDGKNIHYYERFSKEHIGVTRSQLEVNDRRAFFNKLIGFYRKPNN